RHAVEAFGSGAQWFADLDALIADARGSLHEGVVVLIKGSRANKLERVAAALASETTQTNSPSPKPQAPRP
ncbi:MAG: hypothetical protein GX535_05070, partial [Xanthomonadaceae bacterium]|nr:hypothetical protein [Xanthomonadaceae bacterium]